jgi:UDP-2-acetamido-2-deoxy-ribo-hexuluronate aminotransferase
MKIEMVDLKGQYEKIRDDVNAAILKVIQEAHFINGPSVANFEKALGGYLGNTEVISCANGTDALQIAMMALDLNPGDEVIVPAFTYVATAEVIGLLRLTPVLVDVDPHTFNISLDQIERAISPKTRAIVPVHLFGQCADMEPLMKIAERHNLYVIEDTAQAIGAQYTFSDGTIRTAGTIGHIGCTSFFPSKNLGCYGDGGALFSSDTELAAKIRMIANHGQQKKYVHKYIGVNSRLDTVQAAVLEVKLRYLDSYTRSRGEAAFLYDQLLADISVISAPKRTGNSTHVFHQYTIQVKNGKRDSLKSHLESLAIPCMIYYPIPLHKQEAYSSMGRFVGELNVTEELCSSVLSLPMHTEITPDQVEFIAGHIRKFLNS